MAKIQLREFEITNNGFLPSIPPLSELDNGYYAPWEEVARNLPELIRLRTLRKKIIRLPILSTEHLTTEPEWHRAHTILTFLAHAYIWCGEEPEEVLPAPISVPLLATARHVELPPVLTCATVNLWNYTLKGSSLSNPDDIEIHTTFTGTESEAWFLAIGTAVEANGAHLVQLLLDAFLAVPTKDYTTIARSLALLRDSLSEMTTILGRMPEKCDPMTFCHQVRPFYAGSKGMANAGLPRGVFYEDGNGNGQWFQLPGGSNGQSALLQLFDIALGLGYSKSDDPARKREGYYYNTRECTPGPHRRFLALVGESGSIRNLCLEQQSELTDEQAELREAYKAAVEALALFRSKHIQIVTRFVTMPLRHSWQNSPQSVHMPGLLPSGLRDNEKYGTAGTPVLQFLKKLRNETTMAGELAGSI